MICILRTNIINVCRVNVYMYSANRRRHRQRVCSNNKTGVLSCACACAWRSIDSIDQSIVIVYFVQIVQLEGALEVSVM